MRRAAQRVVGMDAAVKDVRLAEGRVHQLVIAAQEGDDSARNVLLESGYLRLADTIADAYWRRAGDLCDRDDLFSEAALALMELAIPRYNGRVPFQQWAQLCIRARLHGYIRRELLYHERTVLVGHAVDLSDMARAFGAVEGEDRDHVVAMVGDTCAAACRAGVIKARDAEWLVMQANGFTQDEIATRYGCSQQRVADRMQELVKAVREWTSS